MSGWGAKMVGRIDLDHFEKGAGPKTMRLIGEAARDRILDETQDQGKDQNNRRFRRYSAPYAAVRKAAGYGVKPDLTVTGQMLNAVSVISVTAHSVTIGFLDSQPTERRTLLQKAWPRLSASQRNMFWKFAAAAKRKAGKRRGTGRRRNPSAERGRSQGPVASGHPLLLPSEKMQATNTLRPWFGFGRANSKRRAEIQRRGARMYIEALTRRGGGSN